MSIPIIGFVVLLGGLVISVRRDKGRQKEETRVKVGEPEKIDSGPIVSTSGVVTPSPEDFIVQTAPGAEVAEDVSLLEFSGLGGMRTFDPQVEPGGVVIREPGGARTLADPGMVVTFQTFETRHPGSRDDVYATLELLRHEQATDRQKLSDYWQSYRMLQEWLYERGVIPVFQIGPAPLEYELGPYRESARDKYAIRDGYAISIDPAILTRDQARALNEGRIWVDWRDKWWTISQRAGQLVAEPVPVGEAWEQVEHVSSKEFQARPRWLVKGDSARVLVSRSGRDAQGRRTYVDDLEPPGITRNLEMFYNWRF